MSPFFDHIRETLGPLSQSQVDGINALLAATAGMSTDPRAVALPWDTRTAENLQGLFDDPANQGQAMMRFEWSWNRHPPEFYPLPQPPVLPPKAEPPAAPHFEL